MSRKTQLEPSQPVPEQIGFRDEAVEPPFEADDIQPINSGLFAISVCKEVSITARWLRGQALNGLSNAVTLSEEATHLWDAGLADAARDKMITAQECEWQGLLHGEKLLELAEGSFFLLHHPPVQPTGDNLPEYEAFCDSLINALEGAGELADREALFTERNDKLHHLWREWDRFVTQGGVSNYTEHKAQWQPRWDALYDDYLRQAQAISERGRAWHENNSPEKPLTQSGRTGTKPQIKPAPYLRLPTAEYVKNAMMGLARGQFVPTEGKDGVFTQIGETQLRIECDALGFDALRAVEMLAAYGPSAMQTFLGLMGLWVENNPGASHETYYTARASDLMRYMGRKELPGGSYHTDDQMQKGREIYILSRAAVPRATIKRFNGRNGARTVETISLDRLLHVQTVTAQRTLERGKEIQSILEFRYHPNKEMHGMLCGDTPQFAAVSGKLLAYHPVRDKYQIVLGFGLAFYDRVNRKHGRRSHRISLPALLTLAGVEAPSRNVPRFLAQIRKAVEDLSADGVIVGAALEVPRDNTLSGRQQLAASEVRFPALPTTLPKSIPA